MTSGSRPQARFADLVTAANGIVVGALGSGALGSGTLRDGAEGLVLCGIGWATVELDRAAEELSAGFGARPAWAIGERDELLGAATRVADVGGGERAGTARDAAAGARPRWSLILLEPDTEGRLAATLARSGEGVAVAYVSMPRPMLAALALTREAHGPLGAERLVLPGRAWGPHLVVIRSEPLPGAARGGDVPQRGGRPGGVPHSGAPRRRYHRSVIGSTPTLLRPAVPTDSERIAALLSDEGYPVGPTDIEARLARFDDRSSAVVVAEIDGAAIGFIALHTMPRFEHDDVAVRILALVVDPSARERGVGGLLMAEAERFAAERGAAFVEVTAGHHRPDARRLYESLGYDPAATAYLRKRL